MTAPPSPPDHGYVFPPRYWAWLGAPRTLAVLLWVAAIGCGVAFTYRSFHWFDSPATEAPDRRRADGNAGHAQIDFGGQWLMGRMLVTGHGRELYHRQRQRRVLQDGFLIEHEAPIQRGDVLPQGATQSPARPGEDWQHDSANLMNWFMGSDPTTEWKVVGGSAVAPLARSPGNPLFGIALEEAAAARVTRDIVETVNKPAVGGPLYPPVHVLFYAPLGAIDSPQRAYHVFQVFCALLIPVAGLGVNVLTRGRIWWSVATLGLFLFPGTRGALDLGQNPTLSLCIVIWGWALASRGRNVGGGMVWGLLAFKPVWAAAFFLVPLLMRRWRFCLAMVLTGAALGLLTLPFVGVDSWFHWLQIGSEASDLYKVNNNWIHLSRDLQGLPRRVLLDFDTPDEAERKSGLADALALGLLGAVFAATVVVYALRGDRTRPTGLSAGFLFLGAYLTCFHFMYYDVLLASVGCAVLFADPKRYLRTEAFAVTPAPVEPAVPADRALPAPAAPAKPLGARMLGYVNSFPLTVVVALFVLENSLSGMELEATVGIRYYATPATDGSTNVRVPRLKGDTGPRYPTDTFLVLALWAWCGWRLVRGDETRAAEK
ncbi:glycosyltransferase family 87 protein [Frigoriglobus tundricola]|uniref:DUF2029 domain-containing protein n=1 Tax=Frigoriglobus tundricola TaxID=2774151 RepID=A0A6M5YIL9_9BACT|nr:glycosyltransferase family 87 protein [Frigoriglobus tundricola]QJW93919.1 hypothetical protein FTUN_1433 [Frigoriglobus tundricola]